MFACAQWGVVGEFVASRHGVISRQQASELGISAKVVARWKRDGHLDEPLPTVLVAKGAMVSWHQRLMVPTVASRGAAIAGFRSAAALHGFDGYPSGPVELIVPSPRRVLQQYPIVHQTRVGRDHVVVVRAIRCTGIARTLIDLAGIDDLGRVALAFDSAWRQGSSLEWIRRTAEGLRGSGRSGATVVLDLVNDAIRLGAGTESALEHALARVLTPVRGLKRQHVVRADDGRFIARVDFAVPAARVAIEAHSRRFHFGAVAVAADELREHALRVAGWDVLFFGQKSLDQPDSVLAVVQRIVLSRLPNSA